MSIIKATNDKGIEFLKYSEPDESTLYGQFVRWTEIFCKYIQMQNLDFETVQVNRQLIGELIVRVDKRKDYFIIFHEGTVINDVKEAALVAYWIIKFKPFTLVIPDKMSEKVNLRINEGFAAFIMLGAIKENCKRLGCSNFNISKEYREKLMYALKYWDLSKEAIILIAETLCENILHKSTP